MIKIKRAYEKPTEDDGYRILVDRLWPRGVAKNKAKIDLWLKQVSPSDELRKWFSHDSEKWDEFKKRYHLELKSEKTSLQKIKQIEKENKIITLVYAAKDNKHNNAIVLVNELKNW
ncbi:MAG: DUF488 domain-containing protein [Thaumarchaeota archaeon]|nr:DUF488 domain-containing protein [Nitrososphaerota archaeon]